MIYSGDISFSIKETDIPYKQYYLSNKVVFSIYMPGKILNKVTIEYEANLNTFFNAKYSIDSVNNEQLQDIVPSGESYLVQINPSSQIKSKTVLIKSAYNYRRPFKIIKISPTNRTKPFSSINLICHVHSKNKRP